ncbi:large conductance mechanosensitive channel protein MscL [Agromyces archimandritae]|uniref:Large-conductance mechanosensitive channel n=1 Tax=Agromyces archimandritae TaxID=2781962 RepID=A0A975FK54_9MICO|nr:large conductance mechanosensitive channel protein MscL [Agromyces archimandritae]QTX04023.1 large conductance mechanosensitive channel protein MscL [Agromyces archimandritae]
MLKGFRDFIARGNVIDLAVAVVIGAAFTAVVTSIVENLINPLIGLVFNAESLNTALILEIGYAKFKFGAIIGSLISFLAVAAVVYFVFVYPMNTLREHQEARAKTKGAPEEDAPPPSEAQLLTEIRDLLAADARRGRGTGD